MCLIVVGWRVHPDYPLLVAANRDEFYHRPTALAAPWPDAPQVIGGLDLEAGGTWLGVSAGGRFAAITNVREPGAGQGQRSRGLLPRDFLLGDDRPEDFARHIDHAAYAGFNLLLADGQNLYYCSNRIEQARPLAPGIYGLSNQRLDTPWPKLLTARDKFAAAIGQLPAIDGFFDLLADASIVADENLPDTGVSLEWERRLSAIFVRSEDYGTRASTVLWRDADGGMHLHERSFGPQGRALQSSSIATGV